MKRQNAVSAHLRTNLPRGSLGGAYHSDTASFAMFRKARSGVDQPPTRKTNQLQIAVRLAPAIFIDDICERDTANWTEPEIITLLGGSEGGSRP